MRSLILLPLSAVAIAVAGCQPEAREQSELSTPERDVTLPNVGPPVEVASLVELQAPRVHQVVQRSRPGRRPAKASSSPMVEAKPAPEIVATLAVAVSHPPSTAEETTVGDRELPPGKTITLIPTSSGPSTATDYIDEFPPEGSTIVRRGARCPPRNRPGIGIATRPRPSLY